MWLPGRTAAPLGLILTFPQKLPFFPLRFSRQFHAWMRGSGKVSASACISLSLLMESLFKNK